MQLLQSSFETFHRNCRSVGINQYKLSFFAALVNILVLRPGKGYFEETSAKVTAAATSDEFGYLRASVGCQRGAEARSSA